MSEDQYTCSICLHVFTEPVSTACGHNFCQDCMRGHLASSYGALCPLCKKSLNVQTKLQVNREFRDLLQRFNNVGGQREPPARPGEVSCDVCPGPKLKAVKSCLTCLVSYCQPHLEPHHRVAAWREHMLIDPVENLENRVCEEHNEMLAFFCRTHQECVCTLCLTYRHTNCEAVFIEEECGERKTQLGEIKANIKQMLQTKSRKIQEVKRSMELGKREAQEETADSVEVFSALMALIEIGQAKLMEVMEEKQRAAEEQAEGFIEELQQEITELQRRNTELDQLSHTEDHLHFLLQTRPYLSMPPHTKEDLSESRVCRHLSVGTVRRAVAPLEEILRKEMERVIGEVGLSDRKVDKEAPGGQTASRSTERRQDEELRRIQQVYAVEVTLDAETANPHLILSDDRKQVRHTDVKRYLLSSRKRFDCFLGVMGSEGFVSGRFYYEVQVKGKTAWTLGVARESVYRKGWTLGLLSPAYGCWTLGLRQGCNLQAFASTPVYLSERRRPDKVGVFVDYDKGEVFFYDVEAGGPIYSFSCCNFTEKIYPFFSPSGNSDGTNAAPLVITAVGPRP